MRSSIFNGEADIKINYIFNEAQPHSDTLVVSFPGAAGDIPGGEWGYLMTIKPFNVNSLFIKSNKELNQSWLTFVNGKPIIENTVKALIDMCAAKVSAARIIATGSSMGGFDALYYGLKYDYDIISGTPPYTITNPSMIMYAVGGCGNAETDWFNEQIHSAIVEAGKRGYNKKIFISWGEGELNWLAANQGKKLIKDLEEANIKFTYKLYPYSDHHTIYTMFPDVLKARLGYYLGLSAEPSDDEETDHLLSPDAGLFNDLREIYSSLTTYVASLREDIEPCFSINDLAHYGDLNPGVALRNFVYVEQGWYWGAGFREPIKMPDKNAFWRILPKNKVAEGVCFWFQDTLLNFYEQEGEIKALEWCAENARQYLEYISRVADPKHNENWWNSLRRMHFFMSLYKDLNERGINEKLYKDIRDEICRCIDFFILQDVRIDEAQGQYRRTLGLLHAAAFFRECGEFYEAFYNAALTILNMITNYYFDANGVCILLQIRDHGILTEKLMQNINFIAANGFPETKGLYVLKSKYNKIVEFAAHITAPNGTMPALGHSVYEKAWWTQYWLERKTGNYILRNSNIAILNDENDYAYITVNGGSNVHSNYKHCDLLSFTWWYDNVQVFSDSEGGRSPLDEFACSAMAHSGIIVDDLNYITPSYEDFTSIEAVDEREDCVILEMSHNCYEGVTLKRRLMWIKPNIIVLFDEAESDTEHKYTQNFVLQNWKADVKDKSKVTIAVARDFTATISQYAVPDNDFELKIFNGTVDVNNEANYRGSLITGWTKLRKGCGLAYTKTGSNVKFLTAIELHGSSEGISEHENGQVKLLREGESVIGNNSK